MEEKIDFDTLSLKSMVEENAKENPLQAPQAVKEYLFNIGARIQTEHDENGDEIEEQVGDEDYENPASVSWLQIEENDSEEIVNLKKKLHKVSYFNQFKTAIAFTSVILSLAAYKVVNDNAADFDRLIKEYLLYAQKDDRDIYDMRFFYLNRLTADVLQIGRKVQKVEFDENNNIHVEYEDEKDQSQEVFAEILRAQNEFNFLSDTLKKKYAEKFIYLLS
jgi:hypothetical protein